MLILIVKVVRRTVPVVTHSFTWQLENPAFIFVLFFNFPPLVHVGVPCVALLKMAAP